MASRYAPEIKELCKSDVVGHVSGFLETGKTAAKHMEHSFNLIAERGDLAVVNGLYAEVMELIVSNDSILQEFCAILAKKKETVEIVTEMFVGVAKDTGIKGFEALVDPSEEKNLYAAVLDFTEDVLNRDLEGVANDDKTKTLNAIIGIKNSIAIDKNTAEEEAKKAAGAKCDSDEVARLRKELADMQKAMDASKKTTPVADAKPTDPDLAPLLAAGGTLAANAVAGVAAALGIVPKKRKARGPAKPKADTLQKDAPKPRARKQGAPKKVVAVEAPIPTAPVMSAAAAAKMHATPMMTGRIPVQMNGMMMWLTPEEIKTMAPTSGTPPF